MVYEALKKIALIKYGSERKITFLAIFIMSSIGKILATLATYPILTVRTKLQADKNTTDKLNLLQKIRTAMKESGFLGLYRGLEVKIIQTVLNNAFLMMTYEKLRNLIKILLFRAVYLRYNQ